MFVWTRGCLCSLMSDLFWLPRLSLLYTTGKVDRAAAFSMSEKVPTGILLYQNRLQQRALGVSRAAAREARLLNGVFCSASSL